MPQNPIRLYEISSKLKPSSSFVLFNKTLSIEHYCPSISPSIQSKIFPFSHKEYKVNKFSKVYAWKSHPMKAKWSKPKPFKYIRKGGKKRFLIWWLMEGSKLDGLWQVPKLVALCNVPSLMAYGRFQAWWFMKCPSFVAYGRRGGNIHLIFFPFHKKWFHLFHSPLILRFLFYLDSIVILYMCCPS